MYIDQCKKHNLKQGAGPVPEMCSACGHGGHCPFYLTDTTQVERHIPGPTPPVLVQCGVLMCPNNWRGNCQRPDQIEIDADGRCRVGKSHTKGSLRLTPTG